jgi:hypothetical protein
MLGVQWSKMAPGGVGGVAEYSSAAAGGRLLQAALLFLLLLLLRCPLSLLRLPESSMSASLL